MARSPLSHASPTMCRVLVEIAIGVAVLSAIVAAVDWGSSFTDVSVVAPRSHWFLPNGTAAPQLSMPVPAREPGLAAAAAGN